MRDVLAYELSGTVPDERVIERIRELLSEFKWRGGDSDIQGPYQSGASDDGTNLKIWLGEEPYDVLLSFSLMTKDMINREATKLSVIRDVTTRLSSLGSLVDVTAKD